MAKRKRSKSLAGAAGTHVVFLVDTKAPDYMEKVTLHRRSVFGTCAVLHRYQRPIAKFVATDEQVKKLRRRHGRIEITEKAVRRAQNFCSDHGYGR